MSNVHFYSGTLILIHHYDHLSDTQRDSYRQSLSQKRDVLSIRSRPQAISGPSFVVHTNDGQQLRMRAPQHWKCSKLSLPNDNHTTYLNYFSHIRIHMTVFFNNVFQIMSHGILIIRRCV